MIIPKLINARDRGSLWRVHKKVEKVFLQAELIFCARAAAFTTTISCPDLVRETLKEPSVLSNYEDICLDSNLKLDKEVSMDLLENIVALYIRVRTFSFAKDVQEKHKLAKKQAKNGPYELK